MLNAEVIREFLADESGGERDTLTTLLLLALIILPLVAVIIFFGGEIKAKVEQVWADVFGSGI